jgi:hypothetical protein
MTAIGLRRDVELALRRCVTWLRDILPDLYLICIAVFTVSAILDRGTNREIPDLLWVIILWMAYGRRSK